MSEFIANSIKGILRDALVNFSKEGIETAKIKYSQDQKPIILDELNAAYGPSKFQLIIATRDNTSCEPFYQVMHNGSPFIRKNRDSIMTNEVSFLEILNVKMDFLDREERSKPLLIDSIKRFAKELGCDPDRVNIMVMTNDDKKCEPYIFLWVKDFEGKMKQVRQLDVRVDILNDPDVLPQKT